MIIFEFEILLWQIKVTLSKGQDIKFKYLITSSQNDGKQKRTECLKILVSEMGIESQHLFAW